MKTEKSMFRNVRSRHFFFNNAIVMAPMTRSRAIGAIPNALMAQYYAQRSSAGLIVTEGTSPSADGIGYARPPGIYSEKQIEGWRAVTEAVHARGGKIFLQLMHVGRISHPENLIDGGKILAPSAIAPAGMMWTDSLGLQPMGLPAEMTAGDIQKAISDFVAGAKNARLAGFDGVELHGANGYLLEQFLNPHTNKRNDAYGGSVVNRGRFVIELANVIADAIGPERVGVRFSPYSTFNDLAVYDEINQTYSHLSKELSELGLLYLHVVDYAARNFPEGIELLKTIRNNFGGLLILNGGYTLERAEHAMVNNEADMISFGSSFLANPDLPNRLLNGIPLNSPDKNSFYTADAAGYTDYPFALQPVLS
jgi:N-ethylmaleimide reductase